MSATIDIFKKYRNNIFIETGSYKGSGIQMALDAGYERIYSIELSPLLWNYCRNKFKGKKNVLVFVGYSPMVLTDILEFIDEPITFWLDAHYSGGITAKGEELSPVLKELNVIRDHSINTHTIMIDDIRDWETHGYGISVESAKEFLLTINKDYKFTLENGTVVNDILVASI